jgi:hypothetical protein
MFFKLLPQIDICFKQILKLKYCTSFSRAVYPNACAIGTTVIHKRTILEKEASI